MIMSWTVIIYVVLPVLCLSPGSVFLASGQVQMTDIKVLERGDDWQCPSMEERERARNEIHQIAASVIATMTTSTRSMPTTTSISTTAASTTTMPLTTTSVTTMSTMTGTYTCNGTPGWRRVAFINMTDTSYNCPTGLRLTSYSKRTCGRSHTELNGCSSTTFSVGDIPYSWVCGRIRGYQYGSTSAFGHTTASEDIDSQYVDGISLTHGVAGSRQHIWTFAAGLTEASMSWTHEHCPCDTSNSDRSVPPGFVGDDYFCESGLHSPWSGNYYTVFHSNDVLWDGQNCTSTSTCCQLNNPPWFTKNLPNATTDNIEFRLCTDYTIGNEDVPIELIELYVQ